MKQGDQTRNIVPVVRAAKPYHGQTIPFYDITWPDPVNPSAFSVADIEVDAHQGRIISFWAVGSAFSDLSYLQQISNQVYKSDAPKSVPVPEERDPSDSQRAR